MNIKLFGMSGRWIWNDTRTCALFICLSWYTCIYKFKCMCVCGFLNFVLPIIVCGGLFFIPLHWPLWDSAKKQCYLPSLNKPLRSLVFLLRSNATMVFWFRYPGGWAILLAAFPHLDLGSVTWLKQVLQLQSWCSLPSMICLKKIPSHTLLGKSVPSQLIRLLLLAFCLCNIHNSHWCSITLSLPTLAVGRKKHTVDKWN